MLPRLLNPLPVFDYQALSDRLMGDEHLLRTLVSTFVESTEEQMTELRQAIESERDEEIRALAHKLKGAAANMGVWF